MRSIFLMLAPRPSGWCTPVVAYSRAVEAVTTDAPGYELLRRPRVSEWLAPAQRLGRPLVPPDLPLILDADDLGEAELLTARQVGGFATNGSL